MSADHNDADIMFAQMMSPHHQQAVEMSEMLLAKEGIPAQVVEFAQAVIDAQGSEIDRMNAMLEAWGQQPVTDSGGMGTMDEMGGMDHGEMGGMSGMMSQEDMTALEEAQGTEAARLYLEQMTAHHEGAVDMARDEVADGQPLTIHRCTSSGRCTRSPSGSSLRRPTQPDVASRPWHPGRYAGGPARPSPAASRP
ncbi:hypothetical protein CU7111_0110 [Corynebacterium urealyticum DSM 7111]|nr:hypothetical protein CU7111_0110 [Corynebacterium urealyticum DSM 7111]